MIVKTYRDDSANAVFIENSNGAQFLNNLQAISSGTKVSIRDISRDIEIVSELEYSSFVDENSISYGADSATVVNELNSVFQETGTGTDQLPAITSTTSINSVTGNTINYELIADYGVGYEWSNLPAGLTTAEGNNRKLIGGTGLAAGTYNVGMSAINYNGQDSETLVINVSNPPFSNTKSVRFNQNDWCECSPDTNNPLYRSGNGSGSSDAWGVSFFFKAGSNTNSEQTILMFGGSDQTNEGRVQLWYDGSGGDKRLKLRYGSDGNNVTVLSPPNSVTTAWNHFIITYDGGTTGASSGSLSSYYGRFKMYINGSSVSLTGQHNNFGFTGDILPEYFRVGRNGTSGNYMRNSCTLDELALWGSDITSDVSSIYNSGVPHYLTSLTNPPDHWWRMGDGDTYPILYDFVGSLDLDMQNMTAADITNDTP
jgi:hypothetical protein